jgi:protein O-mannosyl-transferase
MRRSRAGGRLPKGGGRRARDRPSWADLDAVVPAWAQALVLCAVGAVTYLDALGNPFLWDDKLLVVENRFLRSPRFLAEVFSSGIFQGAGLASQFYRPVQMLSYMLDYAVWGTRPFGYHLTNVLLHLLAGLLVWRLARRLVAPGWAALWVAASFLVHPVQVEAVTYVAGRADILATLCLLGATACVLRGAADAGAGPRWLAPAALLYALALLGKEMAVVYPFLLAALGLVGVPGPPAGLDRRRVWCAVAAMAGVLAAYGVLRLGVDVHAGRPPAWTPFPAVLWLVPRTVVAYLALFLFPLHLHMERLVLPARTLGAVVAVAVVLASWWAVRPEGAWRRAWLTGATWFGVCLLPVANVVSLNAAMAEHWLYLPSLGLLGALAAGGGALLGRAGARSPLGRGLVCLAVLLPVLWSARTIARNRDWRDEVAFFEQTLSAAPTSARVHELLATHYARAGDATRALEHYRAALAADPTYALAYSNRGRLYYLRHDLARAEADCRRAVELDPRDANASNNLGNVYYDQRRFDEALASYRRAAELFPLSAEAYENIGNVAHARGDLEGARRAFARATELAPRLGRVWYKLGTTLTRLGEGDAGAAALGKAAALDPSYAGPSS